MKTITKHYIDGAFVESHGREVMDIIRPTDGQVIGRLTLGDYAARDHRGQARVRDLRPVDEGRTGRDSAPIA
jgi:acyl-CoA reductase-like NAD-dependent aldehyde dehydrogenase